MPEAVPLGVAIPPGGAGPTANSRAFPDPVHCNVAPLPWMLIVERMIGVAVGPYGL